MPGMMDITRGNCNSVFLELVNDEYQSDYL